MSLIRTFHPVGQGAFYSERHIFNGTEFTVVYDCGSTTLKKQKFEKKIKSTFPKTHPIDILFISHFHADHINGIEVLKKHCTIKRVVLPLLDADAKTLVKVTNLIDSNYTDTRLIDNPADFFGGDIPIISINPAELNQNDNGVNLENVTDISTINNPESISASGTVFKLLASIDWFFIPFNYKHNERKTQFVAALSTYGLNLTDIDTINKINANKDNIIKAYDDVDGDLNKNSMALFSGKQKRDEINCFQHNHSFSLYHILGLSFQSGCLYMGDIDLTSPDIVRDIKTNLKQLISSIGTLQVPHHGSIHNFDKSILHDDIRCAIFSYGTTNTYGHPSDRVIGDVIANKTYPHLVTEEQHSIVTQSN
jgi:Metallo-beta-lactamase superfamily